MDCAAGAALAAGGSFGSAAMMLIGGIEDEDGKSILGSTDATGGTGARGATGELPVATGGVSATAGATEGGSERAATAVAGRAFGRGGGGSAAEGDEAGATAVVVVAGATAAAAVGAG